MDSYLNKLLNRKKQLKRDGKWKDYAEVVHQIAYYYKTRNEWAKSVGEFRELAEFYATRKKDELSLAKVHRYISEIYLEQGDFKESLTNEFIHYKKVAGLNDAAETQRALATLSRIYLTQAITTDRRVAENLEKAKKYAEMSLSKCDELTVALKRFERLDMKARVLQNLSVIHENLSDLEESKDAEKRDEQLNVAIKYVLRSLEICKEIDNFKVLYQTHYTVAQLYQKKHEYRNALYHLDEALQLVPRLKHGGDKVASHYELFALKSQQFFKLDDYNGAKYAAAKAFKLFTGSKSEKDQLLRRAKLIVLIASCEKNLVDIRIDDFSERKKIYEKMGDACCELEEFEKAVHFYRAMLECCEQIGGGDWKELAACFVSLAVTYRDLSDWTESLRFFRQELALYRNLETDWKSIVETLKNMAEIERKLNPAKEPNRFYCEEMDRLRSNGHHSDCDRIALDRIHQQLIKSEKGEKEELKMNEDEEEGEEGLNNSTTTLNLDDIDISAILNEDEKIDLDNPLTNVPSESANGSLDSRKRQKEKFRVKKNIKGETQLHTACIDGNVQLCRQLLAQGHPVNVRDCVGWLPIHEAANYGHLEICDLLLKHGAFVNDAGGKDCCGITPLLDAAINGHLETCELLIRNGASLIAKTHQGQTVLDHLKTANENFGFESDRGTRWSLYKRLVTLVSSALEKTVKLGRKSAGGGAIASSQGSNCSVGSLRKSLDDERPLSPIRRHANNSLDSEATRVYSDTIRSLRRRQQQQQQHEDDCDLDAGDESNVRIVSAFVNEPNGDEDDEGDQVIDTTDMIVDMDNWIEDDLGEEAINRRQKQKRNQRRSASLESDMNPCPKRLPEPDQLPETAAINVRIDAKLFRVPVPIEDSRSLTLQWLADEACKRFVSLNGGGAVPEIQLRTLQGALMSHSDPLYTGLALETIDSMICSWQTVPLREQFRNVCKMEKFDPSETLLKQVDSSETTAILDLKNQLLDPKAIQCLLKSLENQQSLSELNLSGNRLDCGEHFNSFLGTIKTLKNLKILNLRATNLTGSMLELFANDANVAAIKLTKLDLSCNRFGNESGRLLAQILDHFKSELRSFNVSGCDFESGLFSDAKTVWNLNSLEYFAIGANHFDFSDLEMIFQTIDWHILKRLDLKLIPVRIAAIFELFKRFCPAASQSSFRSLIDVIDCF